MDGIRTQADKIKNWGALAYFFWLCWWAISFFSWFWKRYAAHELLFVFDKQENRLLFLDFTNHYMGGKLAVSPLRHSIYDPTVQLNFYRQLLAPQHVDVSQYCQVTPWFFLYMVPFGLFPIEISYLIWNVLWCTFGLICLDQLVRYLGMKDVKERIFLCAWLFGFYPAQDTIIGGQNSWMLLGLLALYCRFWFESRDIACGVSLGLSLIRPQYFLFLLIPAIAQRRWRIVAASFSTCFILLFMSGLVFGFDTVINYPKLVAAVDSADWAVIPWRMVSIRGPLTILLEQKLAFQISSAIALLALVAFFFMWTKTKTSKAALLPAFAATIVGMLVFSPHTHVHDLILLAIPFVLIAPTLWNKNILGSLSRYQRMCIGIFVFLPVLIFLPMMGLELFAPKDSLEHGKLYAWSFNAINLLLLFLTLQLWQSAQREPDRRSPGANEQEENVNPEFH